MGIYATTDYKARVRGQHLALAEHASAPQKEEVEDFYDAEQTNSHAESKETPDAANTSIVIVIV